MLSDDEIYHLADTFELHDLTMWPDLQEGRQHFASRTYRWWGEYFGHPFGNKGHCLSCGRGGSCIFQVMIEGVAMATIAALGRTDRLMGLPGEDCKRVEADEPHHAHVHNPRADEWAVCDGSPTFVFWTEPWEHGEVVHILNASMERELGTTQTHEKHPDTPEEMARDWLSLTLHCQPDMFDVHQITPFWMDQLKTPQEDA